MAEKECIEREAAIAVIEEKQKELCPVGMYSRHAVYGSDREKFDAWQEIIDTLESIPAADVRPVVKAAWEQVEVRYEDELIDNPVQAVASMFCPNCQRYHNEVYFYGMPTERVNFCPNCGVMMGNLSKAEHDKEQREYEAAVEAAQYCEMYEPTYDPETGAM